MPLSKIIRHKIEHQQVLLYYRAFRHWGHPFIDYLIGLTKLYSQMTLVKEVDETYTKASGSNLVYIVQA